MGRIFIFIFFILFASVALLRRFAITFFAHTFNLDTAGGKKRLLVERGRVETSDNVLLRFAPSCKDHSVPFYRVIRIGS